MWRHVDRMAGMAGCSAAMTALVFLAGCASAPGPGKPAEPEVVRPVVAVERAQTELAATTALLRAGQLRQAEANLEEIIKVRADLPEAHFNLGWVRFGLGRHAQAIGHFEDGLRLRPGDVQAINMLALSQREAGRFRDAEASYRRAIAAAPDYDKPYLNLGILYELYLGDPAQALAQYRAYQARQKAPDARVAGWVALLERQEAKR